MNSKRFAKRMKDSGVSPVIATILMVAITVVLAAVLYVMVSGFTHSPGTANSAG
ncbi:MAG: type IV pilin, partial [Nitrososphaerota archaeon]|nr:type IV pilin [Nitrososphaerota archaeon]